MRRGKTVKLESVQSVLAAFTAAIVGLWSCATGLPVAGAAPSIGTAVAKGSFRVDQATVAGNATLFEGVTIETRQSSSSLDLASGPRLLLGAESRGQIFGDRLILERGSGEMRDAAGFHVEARGLTIRTETGHGAAHIQLTGVKGVQVAALEGGVRVLTSLGVVVAELNTGMALAFEPQGGGSGEPEKFTGCLHASNGHFLVTDDLTSVTVELAGAGVERESGNQVQVTGIMDPTGAPVSGATQYVRVTGLKRLAKGCPANKAAAAGAGGAGNTAGKAAGHAGISATTVAIIGGVAAAAAIGGLAASGSLSSGSSNASVSR